MRVQIRSPSLNQTLDVNLDLNSTIWNLKQEIQQNHPQHPLPSNQRIIFSGKILEDDDSLESILKKLEDSAVPIFHLVVKPGLLSSKKVPSATAAEATTMDSNQPASSFPASSSSSIPNIQAGTNTSPSYPPPLPGGYQLIALNGQYYLAPVLVPANPVPQIPDANIFMQTQTHNNYNQFNHGIPLQNQAQGQQQPQQAGRPVLVRPANAQRAASIWLALKLYFVVFILCQGASLERIILFHAIALVMFMYQTGRLRVVVRRMRVRPAQMVRDPPPPPPQQAQQNVPETTANNQHNQSPPPPQAPATRLEALKRGIYMFIASFWPNYGRDPRIAQAFENEQRQA